MRAQLCATRTLIITFWGQDMWVLLRDQAASSTDEASGARIRKALADGNCK